MKHNKEVYGIVNGFMFVTAVAVAVAVGIKDQWDDGRMT